VVSLAKRHKTFIIKSQNDEFAKIQRLENDFSINASLSTQHQFSGSVETLSGAPLQKETIFIRD